MRCAYGYGKRAGAALLILLLSAGTGVAEAQQSIAENQPATVPSTEKSAGSSNAGTGNAGTGAGPEKLPDSPGAVRFEIIASNPQDVPSAPEQAPPAKPAAEPVGTAAAESIRTSGVAASAPAGTAIAPAKQRQVRSLLIRMGAVLGAGAAVGTVLALSVATPSKPPGAH